MQNGVFNIRVIYCAPCGYTPRVLALTNSILSKRELEYFVKDWQLIPSSGGCYEFEVNGETVFSKKQLGRHAEEGEIENLLTQLVETYKREHNIIIPS